MSDENINGAEAQGRDPKPVSSYEISLDALLSDEVKKRSPEEIKKLRQKLGIGAAAFAMIVALVIYAMQPAQGNMQFGICSTFLELNTPYPHTLNYTWVESGRTTVRIYFNDIDPFGGRKEQMIQCTFEPDEVMGMRLRKVERNRRPVDAELIKKFNIALPAIGASKPYLVLPPDWENPLLSR